MVMKISDNVATDEDEPEFKYIANMHGNEIMGREVTLRFIRHLLENYGKDDEVTDLVNSLELFVMPTMNP